MSHFMSHPMTHAGKNIVDLACERSVWLLTLAKTVLVGWFLLSVFALGQGHATEIDTSCSGTNLLEQMKASNPETYQRIAAEGNKVPNGQSIFWKIEREGVPASYLMGTMHVSNPEIVNLRPEYQKGFDASDTVIIETTDMLDKQKAQAEMMRLSHLTLLTDGSTLDAKLPEELHGELQKTAESHGLPYFAATHMQPWFVSAALSLPVCELKRKSEGAEVLDQTLALSAREKGKNLVGLETIEEQLTAIAATPPNFQLQSLESMLRLGSKTSNDLFYTMTSLYRNNQITYFKPLSDEIGKSIDVATDETAYKEFEQKLITDRNHLMAARAKEHLDKGKVFMAVGALHLPGDEGVVELLKQQGFTLTPVL